MSKKVCVVLSGCGVFDGAEIHESVITLLALSRAGAEYTIAAPDKPQMHVINHQKGEEADGETRNVRDEAARIARGPVLDLKEVDAGEFDALFLPGGFGAAKNLSNFAVKGSDGSADPDMAGLLKSFHDAGKPIGAVCIAPAVLALALGKGKITIGTDQGTADALESLGASHQSCPVEKAVIDTDNKLVTAPAYMADAKIHEVAEGIEEAVQAVLSLC